MISGTKLFIKIKSSTDKIKSVIHVKDVLHEWDKNTWVMLAIECNCNWTKKYETHFIM